MAPKKRDSTAGGASGEDRVRVVVRIRPPVRKDEKFGAGSESLQYDAERNLLFLLQDEDEKDKKGAAPKQFVFDRVLWKDSQQHDAWEAAGKPVVNSVMEGYTGCVMCYGQTGAGKSYTLANEASGQEGIMIAAFKHIFEVAAESRELKYEVAISYQQIYLDTITDLLQPEKGVEIREDPKSGVYVEGAKWSPVTNSQEAIKVLQKGNSNRATACTKMNAGSSRSHAALIVRITTTGGVRTLNGMLYLVDLAGSERVKKSGVEGAALDEAKAINQSLTTLGRCIEVLASNKKEKPPFRESKLTRLLSNAIGGGAKTTLIVCCAPTMTDASETVGSLDFGQQAMNVVVRAKVNASTDYGSLTASLVQQRDKKQKPIRQLELQVLTQLAPQLDECVELELQYKKAALDVEVLTEVGDACKAQLKELKASAAAEEEADRMALVELMNAKSEAARELEQVLVSLSSDPEMAQLQKEHEAEKQEMMERSLKLQKELQEAEQAEQNDRHHAVDKTEGIFRTATHLGQSAAYFLQVGEADEAASLYMQGKSLLDTCLGPNHPKTVGWQEDLFFLLNAPAIQQLVKKTKGDYESGGLASARGTGAPGAASVGGDGADGATGGTGAGGGGRDDVRLMGGVGGNDPYEWWLKDLFSMGDHSNAHGSGRDSPESEEENWWMNSLFQGELGDLIGTPRNSNNAESTGAGQPLAFTPRGTLVALSQVNNNTGAAIALGKPLQKHSGIPEERQVDDTTINMDFAKEWVQKFFLETPRDGPGGADGMQSQKNDAVEWIVSNFGTRGADAENRPPPTPVMA